MKRARISISNSSSNLQLLLIVNKYLHKLTYKAGRVWFSYYAHSDDDSPTGFLPQGEAQGLVNFDLYVLRCTGSSRADSKPSPPSSSSISASIPLELCYRRYPSPLQQRQAVKGSFLHQADRKECWFLITFAEFLVEINYFWETVGRATDYHLGSRKDGWIGSWAWGASKRDFGDGGRGGSSNSWGRSC